MYSILKPLLFLLSPETAHRVTVSGLKIVLKTPLLNSVFRAIFAHSSARLNRNLWGIHFPNPVGLAAGFDKDGKYYSDMAALGFGFIEIGTVTPRPQDGNPAPRLFRLPDDHALINRMGFNNDGVAAMVKRLQQPRPAGLIIGGNIGKNKDTSNEKAHEDYLICFEALFDYVDYFVVNVSSPNTPNLRELQEKEPLTKLLQILQNKNQEKKHPKPILLKIAPDLTNEQLLDIIDIIKTTKTAGIIATNTTVSRENLRTPDSQITDIGAGGLSGAPLTERSTEVIRFLYQHSQGSIPIIAVGGIKSATDAKEKLAAGAVLVQLYTGLIYEGPSLVKRILKELDTI